MADAALEEIRTLRRRQDEDRDNYLRSSLILAGGWSAAVLPAVFILIGEYRQDSTLPEWFMMPALFTVASIALSLVLAGWIHLIRDDWNNSPDGKYIAESLFLAGIQRPDTAALLVNRHRETLDSNENVLSRMKRRYRSEMDA